MTNAQRRKGYITSWNSFCVGFALQLLDEVMLGQVFMRKSIEKLGFKSISCFTNVSFVVFGFASDVCWFLEFLGVFPSFSKFLFLFLWLYALQASLHEELPPSCWLLRARVHREVTKVFGFAKALH